MSACELERVVADGEEVNFLPVEKENMSNNLSHKRNNGIYLTREDLLRLDAEEPVWRRVRLILLIIFCILWVGLLSAAIAIVVVSPKCPPIPKLSFWQNKVGYWLDPFSFSDSNSDLIGDLKGLNGKLNYLKDVVGAGFVILGSFVSGHYTNPYNSLGLTENFTTVDPALGTMSDFRSLIKNYHRNGLEVVITLDFNSVSVAHNWAKTQNYLRSKLDGPLFSRDGSSPVVQIDGRSYYSVGDKKSVDLDLTNEDVVQEIEKIIKFWLNEGADGILLTNAAFYVEHNKSVEISQNDVNASNSWFKSYPSQQIFTNGSVEFVKKLRLIIDSVSSLSGRERLLAVDPGDVGYGITDDPEKALKFLGTKDAPAAHVVVSRQFVKNRGWKINPRTSRWANIGVETYNVIPDDSKYALALTTATPTDQRHSDVYSLAAILLLPGTPVVYYGSELADQLRQSLTSPKNIYPFGKIPFPTLTEQDSTLICQLPMPWDPSGAEFSSASSNISFADYLAQYGFTETVDSALAFGRGYTPLKMFQDLVKLREKPSMKWGEFAPLTFEGTTNSNGVDLFTRKATGFPAFIVALAKKNSSFGTVYNFESVCERVIPRLTYPPRPNLKLDEAVDSNRIYLKANNETAIYVFECA